MILLQETGIAAHLEVTQDLPDIVRDICGIMGGTSQNHQGGAEEERGKRTPPPPEASTSPGDHNLNLEDTPSESSTY